MRRQNSNEVIFYPDVCLCTNILYKSMCIADLHVENTLTKAESMMFRLLLGQ